EFVGGDPRCRGPVVDRPWPGEFEHDAAEVEEHHLDPLRVGDRPVGWAVRFRVRHGRFSLPGPVSGAVRAARWCRRRGAADVDGDYGARRGSTARPNDDIRRGSRRRGRVRPGRGRVVKVRIAYGLGADAAIADAGRFGALVDGLEEV